MDKIKFTDLNDDKYELEIIYDHIIFHTIIEKILTGTLSSENLIIDKLECKALCEHNIIDGILTIKKYHII